MVELQVTRQRCRFVTDSFHQAAITQNYKSVVINEVAAELGAQVRFGHCHTNRIRKALAKGASSNLNACGVTYLWVPRS